MSAITSKDLEFKQGIEAWKESLIKELKLEELGQKHLKKHFDLGNWNTLSLNAAQEVSLSSSAWKKAAQTYIKPYKNFVTLLNEDLQNGVRVFFFHKEFFTSADLEKAFGVIKAHQDHHEVQCILLGNQTVEYKTAGLQVVDENIIAVGRSAHDQGANTIHELGLMGYCLTLKLDRGFTKYYQAVFADSRFFNNIAKIRAAKLIAQKILQSAGDNSPVEIIALNSYREWTLFERYSNMLRNSAEVASSLIAGADLVQTSGYQSLMDFEGESEEAEHLERSLRMARNTSHILGLESMLGVVDDAAYGSFHLENLTHEYAKQGWEFMQELMKSSSVKEKIREVAKVAREVREKNIHTRKLVLAGLNDFADAKEKVSLKNTKSYFYRSTRTFEELRLKVQNLKKAPKVFIGVFGDYAVLNPRLNFAKNYFEVLGLEVDDSAKGIVDFEEFKKLMNSRKEEVLVYCASDADTEKLRGINHGPLTFVAGKVEVDHCQNIFAGQDVYQILSQLVGKWS